MDPRKFQWLPYECRYLPRNVNHVDEPTVILEGVAPAEAGSVAASSGSSHLDRDVLNDDKQNDKYAEALRGKCLKNKRILFSGDSHMRIFFNAFMYQACGVDFSAQKGHATSQCHRPGAASGALCCIEFVYDLSNKASGSAYVTATVSVL